MKPECQYFFIFKLIGIHDTLGSPIEISIINTNRVISGFYVLEETSEENTKTDGGRGQPLVDVVAILECLTSNNMDGRIVCSRAPSIGKASIKYLLLNPAPTFADIVNKAR